jgi:hypothetical protein
MGGGLAAALICGALAQGLYTFNLTGNEIANLALPGGGSAIQTPAYVLRSGENHTLVAAGTTVSTTVPNTSGIVIAQGAITTWNITLPTSPYAGQRVIIACPGGTVSTLTIAATLPSGVALVGTNPTSCTSGGTIAQGVGWTYSVSANTWYRYL